MRTVVQGCCSLSEVRALCGLELMLMPIGSRSRGLQLSPSEHSGHVEPHHKVELRDVFVDSVNVDDDVNLVLKSAASWIRRYLLPLLHAQCTPSGEICHLEQHFITPPSRCSRKTQLAESDRSSLRLVEAAR